MIISTILGAFSYAKVVFGVLDLLVLGGKIDETCLFVVFQLPAVIQSLIPFLFLDTDILLLGRLPVLRKAFSKVVFLLN